MKLIYIYLILLIKSIFSHIYIGRNEKKIIYPSEENTGYIYLYLNQFDSYDTIYIFLEATRCQLSQYIKIAYTDIKDKPEEEQYETISEYDNIDNSDFKGYYFKMDNRDYKYLIIHYFAYTDYSYCILTITTYDANPVDKIYIIISCIIGIILLSIGGVIIYLCIKRRKKSSNLGGLVFNNEPNGDLVPCDPEFPFGRPDEQDLSNYNKQFSNQIVQPNLYQPPQ